MSQMEAYLSMAKYQTDQSVIQVVLGRNVLKNELDSGMKNKLQIPFVCWQVQEQYLTWVCHKLDTVTP